MALRVATHQSRKTINGDKKFFTLWHDVIAWNNTAEFAEQNFVKGSRTMVEGAISYQTYPDYTGHIRYVTFITANSLMK